MKPHRHPEWEQLHVCVRDLIEGGNLQLALTYDTYRQLVKALLASTRGMEQAGKEIACNKVERR